MINFQSDIAKRQLDKHNYSQRNATHRGLESSCLRLRASIPRISACDLRTTSDRLLIPPAYGLLTQPNDVLPSISDVGMTLMIIVHSDLFS